MLAKPIEAGNARFAKTTAKGINGTGQETQKAPSALLGRDVPMGPFATPFRVEGYYEKAIRKRKCKCAGNDQMHGFKHAPILHQTNQSVLKFANMYGKYKL